MKNGIQFVLLLVIIILGLAICSHVNATNEINPTPTVSMTLKNIDLNDVLKEVYKQTEFSVAVDSSLSLEDISGEFVSVSIDMFFQRIFKKYNIIVDTNFDKKIIVVRLFGQVEENTQFLLVGVDDFDSPVALSNISHNELNALLKDEYEMYQKWKNDPNENVPFSDLTKSQVMDLTENGSIQNEKWKENAESIVPLSDLTNNELQAILQDENEKYQNWKEDPDATIPFTTERRNEIEKRLEQEHQEYSSWKDDPNSTIPFSNMTKSEFEAINNNSTK